MVYYQWISNNRKLPSIRIFTVLLTKLIPRTDSKNRPQELIPRTDSKNWFQELIPRTDSKNWFQDLIPRSIFVVLYDWHGSILSNECQQELIGNYGSIFVVLYDWHGSILSNECLLALIGKYGSILQQKKIGKNLIFSALKSEENIFKICPIFI